MLKIDTFERKGVWIWCVYSTVKHVGPNLCACLAHGTAKTKDVAEQRALNAMDKLLKE